MCGDEPICGLTVRQTGCLIWGGSVMAKCSTCGTMILFGGVKEGDLRFCNERCHASGFIATMAEEVPENLVREELTRLHQGACPECGGAGPVDLHTTHIIWSILVMSAWNSTSHLCCRRCGTKKKLGKALLSSVIGWWCFPWGPLLTPVQVTRNVYGIFNPPDPTKPSPELERLVRLQLAQALIAAADQMEQQQSGDEASIPLNA
jgi:hypothetical protein